MAKITLNEPGSFIGFNINILPELTASNQTRTSFRLFTDEFPDSALLFYGEDFTFSSSGKPTGGIVTRLHILIDGKITSTFDDISIPFATLLSQAENRQGQLTLEALLGGDDEISGSAGVDYLIGLSGDDVMIGGGGHDQLDGGAGVDTAVYNSFRTQATVSTRGSSVTTTSPEGTDRLDAFEVLSFVDGRLVYEVTDRAAVVYRLYAAALDRAPDPLGFNGWITALERGTTTESMAGFFAGSPEFLDTYGALTDRGFVEQLYRNVLDREGDAEGVAFWTGRLDAGTLNRGQVLAGFSESPEHVERLRAPVEAGLWDANEAASSAARLYHAALDRAPDADGLRYWTGQIAAGLPVAQAADGFAGSPEFQGRYGALDDDGYVRQLYRNVLDREADPEGLAFWAGEIASGRRDRGDVLAGFSESFEFQVKTLPLVDGGILLA